METSPLSQHSQDGWDINRAGDLAWIPWGEGGARAKLLGGADGYVVALVEADAGYHGTPHEHNHAEFFYLVEGQVTNQGRVMTAGDGYAAAAGSRHDDFRVETPACYVSIFKL
jgi:anti-sigma factor ChrR (cupin superfamily)